VLGGGVGGEGVREGIDASWITEDKIVCIRWQMFVIGRGKGCRDKFALREDPDCLLRSEEDVGIECGMWERGACGGIKAGCVINHEVVCMYVEGVFEGVLQHCNCTRRS